MSNISNTDARPLFTQKLIAAYQQMSTPTAFLRSFFPALESPTKELSIEVQRGFEKVAVDVTRGTEGNRNTWSLSTEKVFVPPYYREYTDITQLAMYDRLFGSYEVGNGVFAQFIAQAATKVKQMQDKIDRAYELQCSQVLQTGIVTLNAGTNIDFKRKAASIVADLGSGSYWSDSIDPVTSIETGCNFLRQVGKVEGAVYNMILGSTALTSLLNNTFVQNRGKIYNYALDVITMPQRNSVGASFHGELSVGSYRVRIWTYPQFYDNVTTGVSTPYIDPKTAILLPESPKFVLGFAAVPQLLSTGIQPVQGQYMVGERATAHIMDIKSAGVAIPVAVDQIYTITKATA